VSKQKNVIFLCPQTPVLTADEARTLLDSIPIIKAAAEDGTARRTVPTSSDCATAP
jgi:hypothetical protein